MLVWVDRDPTVFR